MDDEMTKKARDEVLEAAYNWYVENQGRPKSSLSPAEERLKFAVFMFRRTRSITGQHAAIEPEAVKETPSKPPVVRPTTSGSSMVGAQREPTPSPSGTSVKGDDKTR